MFSSRNKHPATPPSTCAHSYLRWLPDANQRWLVSLLRLLQPCSQEPRLSLKEIYQNKQRTDYKRSDWEGSLTSSPLSPQVCHVIIISDPPIITLTCNCSRIRNTQSWGIRIVVGKKKQNISSLPLRAVGADVGPSSQPAAVGSNLRLHIPLSLQQPLIRHSAPPLPQSRDPRDPRQHGGVQSQPWRYGLW